MDSTDHLRFLHDLYEFNDQNSAVTSRHRFYKAQQHQNRTNHDKANYEVRPRNLRGLNKQRKLLVEILIFCLMPNHYHLLLKQLVDNGIIDFMKKVGTGFAMYFNTKYKRVGPLFQGRFKAVMVTKEAQFIHLPYYIHLNPLELVEPNWKERRIVNLNKSISFLNSYRWSSYLDYTGKKNFPSITKRDFLSKFFDGDQSYKKRTTEWLRELDNLSQVQDISIDDD